MVLFTPNQWTRLRDEEDFLNLDLSYEKNPEGKVQLLCTLKGEGGGGPLGSDHGK